MTAAELDPSARLGLFRDPVSGCALGLGGLWALAPAAGALRLGAVAFPGRPAEALEDALRGCIALALSAGYRRVEWIVEDGDAEGLALAERLGFEREAVFRAMPGADGGRCDRIVLGLLGRDGTAPPPQPKAPTPPGPPRPTRRTLQADGARLAPLTVDHAPALHAANAEDSGAMWDWLPYGPFPNVTAYADWIGGMTLGADPLFYAIEVGGRPVGVASYLRVAPGEGTIEIGHLAFAPALQRTRAATAALSAMIGWAFGAGYARVEWKCDALNAPSRRAALRLGFVFEGITRRAGVVKGRNRDTAWFAITEAEWPELFAAHSAWLAPENFDAEGRQRARLSHLTSAARA